MRLILPLPGSETFARHLTEAGGWELGTVDTRRFPDGETYVRILSDVADRPVYLVCTLARPDDLFLRLVFAADAARSLGAREVTLVAPYLAYMRQDRCFLPGEAVTSKTFARLVSSTFNRLVTVDPHLHRYPALSALYSIPQRRFMPRRFSPTGSRPRWRSHSSSGRTRKASSGSRPLQRASVHPMPFYARPGTVTAASTSNSPTSRNGAASGRSSSTTSRRPATRSLKPPASSRSRGSRGPSAPSSMASSPRIPTSACWPSPTGSFRAILSCIRATPSISHP